MPHSHLISYVATAAKAVKQLDFSLQITKMTDILGWSADAIAIMEEQYRKFLTVNLAIQKSGSNIVIVPNRAIDEFWHMHIMDTNKYASDCQTIFGQSFHHFPYFGMRDEGDTVAWQGAANISAGIWREIFGEELYETESNEDDTYAFDKKMNAELSAMIVSNRRRAAASCGRTNCKPQRCK